MGSHFWKRDDDGRPVPNAKTHKLLIPQDLLLPLFRLIPPHSPFVITPFLHTHRARQASSRFPESVPDLGVLGRRGDPTEREDQPFPLRCVSRHSRDQESQSTCLPPKENSRANKPGGIEFSKPSRQRDRPAPSRHPWSEADTHADSPRQWTLDDVVDLSTMRTPR